MVAKKDNHHSPEDELRREKAWHMAQIYNPAPAARAKHLEDANVVEAWLRDGAPKPPPA